VTIKKRFLVFGGKCFYAAGGFNDLVASFDSAIDAVVLVQLSLNGIRCLIQRLIGSLHRQLENL